MEELHALPTHQPNSPPEVREITTRTLNVVRQLRARSKQRKFRQTVDSPRLMFNPDVRDSRSLVRIAVTKRYLPPTRNPVLDGLRHSKACHSNHKAVPVCSVKTMRYPVCRASRLGIQLEPYLRELLPERHV